MTQKKTIGNKDIELLFETGALRFVPRMWKQFLYGDAANVAEHTHRVIWIALTIARAEGVSDSDDKIMKMAMLHDIAESRTGDAHYVSRHYTKRDDKKAVDHMLRGSLLSEEFDHLLEEYEKRESVESRIVKDADNLDVDLELQEMEASGLSLAGEFKKERSERIEAVLYTETAKEMWREIRKSDPHAWHLKARKFKSDGK